MSKGRQWLAISSAGLAAWSIWVWEVSALTVVTASLIIVLTWFGWRIWKKHRRKTELIAKYGKENGLLIYDGRIWLGMTASQLRDSKGYPDDIDETVLKTKNQGDLQIRTDWTQPLQSTHFPR